MERLAAGERETNHYFTNGAEKGSTKKNACFDVRRKKEARKERLFWRQTESVGHLRRINLFIVSVADLFDAEPGPRLPPLAAPQARAARVVDRGRRQPLRRGAPVQKGSAGNSGSHCAGKVGRRLVSLWMSPYTSQEM